MASTTAGSGTESKRAKGVARDLAKPSQAPFPEQSAQVPEPNNAPAYDLGPLNRHWYRRCLDALDERLRESSGNPSIQDLKELCDDVVTGFLAAVTGQAPDSSRLQFPADRAYFIPFEGDLAESFNFTKPFYRVAEEPGGGQKSGLSKHSIWSFYPWVKGDAKVEIDKRKSVDSKGKTIPFEEMISVRAQFVREEVVKSNESALSGPRILLEKSLVMRGKDRSYPASIFAAEDNRGQQAREKLYRTCTEAVLGIFNVYRMTPGNVAVEAILLHHMTIIRWLLAMLQQDRRELQEGKIAPVAEQDEDFNRLFLSFLRYFLLGITFDGSATAEEEARIEQLARLLGSDLIESRGVTAEKDQLQETEDSDYLLQEFAKVPSTPFAVQRKAISREANGERIRAATQALEADLRSFRKYLLRVGTEERIERDLSEALGGDLLKAGESRQSFVWVTPDFEIIDDSLLTKDFKIRAEVSEEVQGLSEVITRAYRNFCERFDEICVARGDRREKLEAYWRTLGQTSRAQLVFSSFESAEAGLYRPSILDSTESSRLQNFFLRVKICDSLNEPVINGLFVLSTDHDEVKFKGKTQELRKEDREDLLAFAKVYFFIVRDYFRALDQSQAARDIGQLNQYLYDKRLSDLDQRMERRIATPAFKQGSIAGKENWSPFVYEIINNYALSLIEKLEEVQSETFPYDRLLILPLTTDAEEGEYSLPFYLFQAIFAERHMGEIQKELCSLIKPFQSPVEENEAAETGQRFRVKSFQKVSKTGDREIRLERYLEKLYVSADETSRETGKAGRQVKEIAFGKAAASTVTERPESFVVKLCREGEEMDRGRNWVIEAIATFWLRCNPKADDADPSRKLWLDFLNSLTESFAKLRRSDRIKRETAEEQWFLLRFGLLRVLLAGRSEERDTQLRTLRAAYDRDLKLRFNDDRSLDVIGLAREAEPFAKLSEMIPRFAEGLEVQFEPFALHGEDPFALTFFRHLTNLICNHYDKEEDERDRGWSSSAQATWYQPLLTRPIEGAGEEEGEGAGARKSGSRLDLHVKAGRQIKRRIPPYDQIESGEHALSMFLGLVNFVVGQGKQRSRLRCLIAMIRDYDDSRTGADLTQQEREQQLEVDRRDLSLYTTTFFRNVQKFVRDSLAREENRVLSTDVSQIARNWYSSGMDDISLQLRQRLDHLLENRTDFRLGGLRRELMDEFFDSFLKVLLRREERPGSEGMEILLESFPFDRLLHIPLGLGSAEGARLCYARTRIIDVKERDGDKDSWSALDARSCYERIRRDGRTWPQSNGRKSTAEVHHFGVADDSRVASKELAGVLERMGSPRLLDALVRSLYEANAIQTLAVAGLILHLLGDRENDSMRERLEAVIADSIRSVEQQAGESAVNDIHTEVHMDRKAILRSLSPQIYDGSDTDLRRDLQEVNFLPAWYDFFEAAEGGGVDCVYGLRPQGQMTSKLFYVYYSIEAPRTFTEIPATGSRFRGIFALVLDDASTDVKGEDGEGADQQDIRTFVHNGVRSLQLILEKQGLENRLRQPGIESFVIGMLHRLKNELGKPMAVLHSLKEVSRSKEESEQIEGAAASIDGLKELFQSLRGLSEIQQGIVPIRSFSTQWLGWLFIAKLTAAARKTTEELNRERGQALVPHQDLESIRKHAEEALKLDSVEPLRAVDTIQRELKKVESALNKIAGGQAADEPSITISFHVFSDTPLEFLGSFHLEEALNILIENAFQALWGYLEPGAKETPASGLLRMVCRRSEKAGEILIEISNSSAPIDSSVLLVLNDPVPQPMTRQQHATKSGKKGGSGFGHYYARRTVAEFCGGREVRRDLDVKIEYLQETKLARVRVNLIEASSKGVHPVSLDQVQTEVCRNFDSSFDLASELWGGTYYLPQNVEVRSLFNIVRRLLVADREALEGRLLSWWRSRVCRMLSDRCDLVRTALLKRLLSLTATEGEECERWRAILNQIETDGIVRVRRSSFHDLRRFLQQLRDRSDGALQEIAQDDELLKALLGDFANSTNGRFLKPESLIEADDKSKIAKELKRYEPHLKSGVGIQEAVEILLQNLDQDERGRPVPAKEAIWDLLETAQWVVHKDTLNGHLHLAITLVDGSSDAVQIEFNGSRSARVETTFNEYRVENQTFQTYRRLFERARQEEQPVGQLWLEIPRQAQRPRRTVFLVLKRQGPGSGVQARSAEADR
jgi:hypothetical protein